MFFENGLVQSRSLFGQKKSWISFQPFNLLTRMMIQFEYVVWGIGFKKETMGSFHTVLLLRFQRWFCSLRCVRMFKGIGFPLVQYELCTLVSHPRKLNQRLMAHSQGGVSFSKATALDSLAQNSRGFEDFSG